SRVARAVERRLKSTAFQPRYDVVTVTLGVLGMIAFVGWLCGVALDGFSINVVADHGGLLFSALELTLGVLLFALVALGAIVYLPTQAFRLVRSLGKLAG